jgi:hypothetical protein
MCARGFQLGRVLAFQPAWGVLALSRPGRDGEAPESGWLNVYTRAAHEPIEHAFAGRLT